MAIAVQCTCGQAYHLRPEFAGMQVKCPACQGVIDVPVEGAGSQPVLMPVEFMRDKFLMNQKVMSISEKYVISSEQGQPMMLVKRPSHIFKNLVALLAGFLAAIPGAILMLFCASMISAEIGKMIFGGLALAIFLLVLLVVAIRLSPKRHIYFYRGQTEQDLLLQVLQDKKWYLLNATYTVQDPAGQVLAYLRKNMLTDFFRKRWVCTDPNGQLRCIAKEDSVLLALLRRFLGPLFGMLRTNFIFVAPDETTVLGEFNRKFTLLDKYVLDMQQDVSHVIDRRVALAIGVMLDTGERR